MVAVGCVKKNDVAFSGALGCALFPLRDTAMLTLLFCLLFTLSGENFPIFGVLFSPFGFHKVTPGREVPQVIFYLCGYFRRSVGCSVF